MYRISILSVLLILSLNANDKYYYKNNQKVQLFSHNNLSYSQDINYYKIKNGVILGVSNKIIVKVKKNIDINILMSNYNLELIKKLSSRIYLFQVNSKDLTISVSNQLYHEENIEYAQPDFIKKRFSR